MSWEEGIQFIIVLVALYYTKKRIDLYFAKKTAKTTIYKVRLVKKNETRTSNTTNVLCSAC